MENHPKSLRIFFATEMWERYGFYVVQSLLALYLALHFHWPDKQIYALVGSFTAITYLSPLVGGWIADHLIGQRAAISLGAIILFLSYSLLSFCAQPWALTASLAGIAVGTGLLKPNISSLLGNEYPEGSNKRESGFTIFYMGITSGIILGTTIPSLLNAAYGWSSSFISASLGMLIALTVFVYGCLKYKIKDYNSHVFEFKKILLAFLLLTLLWLVCYYILNMPQLANLVFGLVILFSATYILYSVNNEEANQSRQTLVIGLLCIISLVFWAFYFQMFMSLTLFIARVVETKWYGIAFPPPYYVTIQSLGMIVIGYILAHRHPNFTLVERGLSTGKKFLSSMFLTTSAFAIILMACSLTPQNSLISPWFIAPCFLIISLAELLLSPVGLSAITVLADRDKVSTMMGIFFTSLGGGGFLAGKLASLTAIPPGERDILVLKKLYTTAFIQELQILFLATLGCLVLYAVIKFLLMNIDNSSGQLPPP